MNIISNILYWISTGLLVPVIVLLIFFFVRAVILVGAFFGQYSQMRRSTARLEAAVKTLDRSGLDAFRESLENNASSPAEKYAARIIDSRGDSARIELLLSDYELEADKDISASATLTKLGPILGLMGTLIPMGPALVGLATGDIASMAYNMQVAFATTVVGLVVSAIGFTTRQAKERRTVKNLSLLEFIAQISSK